MRLKDYGRNQKKRKEYIHQSGLLIAGVDVSRAKHDICVGTLEGVRSSEFQRPMMERSRAFPNQPVSFCSILCSSQKHAICRQNPPWG